MPPGSRAKGEALWLVLRDKYPAYSREISDLIEELGGVDEGHEINEAVVNALVDRFGEALAEPDSFRADQKVVGGLDATAMLERWPERSHAELAAYAQAAYTYERELLNSSSADLRRLAHEARQRMAASQRRAKEIEDEWQFFSQEEAAANFDKWVKLASWTADQATALSLGKDPDVVNWRTVKATAGGAGKSLFYSFYSERRDWIRSAVAVAELQDPMLPGDFLRWAKRAAVPLPEALSNVVGIELEVCTDQSAGSRLTLYKVLLALAVGFYGFDPESYDSSQGSTCFRRLAEAMANAGLSVDVKTVREHLQAAAKWASENRVKVRRDELLKRSALHNSGTP